MKESIPYSEEIRVVLSEVIEQLSKIESSARTYGAAVNYAQRGHFFSEAEASKKDISTKYFQFAIQTKDIFKSTDRQILILTNIMRKADSEYTEKTLVLCNQILLQYMTLQQHTGDFSHCTEQLISTSHTVPLPDLSLVLRQLLFQVNHTLEQFQKTLDDISGSV